MKNLPKIILSLKRVSFVFLLCLMASGKSWATYNPEQGRFINRDPIGETGGSNLYAMGGNDLVNKYDPLGLKTVVKVGMFGFNPSIPFIPSYGGEGEITKGADATFTSLDTGGAKQTIIKKFDVNKDGKLDQSDCPPFVLNIVGYSWGGWSALDVANDLNYNRSGVFKKISDLQINIGLIDPVSTLRSSFASYKSHYSGGIPGRIAATLIVDDPGVAIGQRPPNARIAEEIYETNGLPGYGSLIGGLFIGTKIDGFDITNLTGAYKDLNHANIIKTSDAANLIRRIYGQE